MRTKDWVAPWNASGHPGQFQVTLDGVAVKEIFGTKGIQWCWHDGGMVEIKQKEITVGLHDLTGFDGRCDALLFSEDPNLVPDNDSSPKAAWRSLNGGTRCWPIVGGQVRSCGGGRRLRRGGDSRFCRADGVPGGFDSGSSCAGRQWKFGNSRLGSRFNPGVDCIRDWAKLWKNSWIQLKNRPAPMKSLEMPKKRPWSEAKKT